MEKKKLKMNWFFNFQAPESSTYVEFSKSSIHLEWFSFEADYDIPIKSRGLLGYFRQLLQHSIASNISKNVYVD